MLKSIAFAVALCLTAALPANADFLKFYNNDNCTPTDNEYLRGFYAEGVGYYYQPDTQIYLLYAPNQECANNIRGAWGAGVAWWQAGYCPTAIQLAQSVVYYVGVRACG
jgi:hypothetical protein